MPTINKTFLAKLVLAVALLAGALFGVHAVQAGRIPDALARQAERAAAAGKAEKAVHYLRQYLEFRPADVDAQERLAALLRGRGGDGSANDLHYLYSKILRADPDRHDTRREALKLCLRMGRFADAETHAEALLKLSPADGDLWQQLAAAQAGARNPDAAVKSYETAIAKSPGVLLPYRRLADFQFRELRRPDDAKKTFDRMVAAAPNDPEAYLARGRFAAGGPEIYPTADADPILADAKKALALRPNDPDASTLAADRLQRHRDVPGALAVLTAAAKAHPGSVSVVRQLAWLESYRGNPGAAIAALEAGLTAARDGTDLLVPLAELLLQFGDPTRAEDAVRKFDAKPGKPAKLQAKYLRGRLAMGQGKWADAVALLAPLRAEAVELPALENQANQLLAACHQKTGDADGERECLRLLLARDPLNVPARVQLAQLFLADGGWADALREYETAAQSPAATGSVFTAVVRMRAAKLSPGGPGWVDVENRLLEFAPRFGTESAEPAILRAELAAGAGNPVRAVEILKAEAAKRPGESRVWAAYASAAADAGGVADGLAVLDEAQSAGRDGPELRLARAELYARDPARLRPLAPLEVGADAWPDGEQLQLLYGLADAYDRTGDAKNALRIHRRIAARRPTDVAAWDAVYRRAGRAGDAPAAAVALAKITAIEGENGPTAALCRATAKADIVKHFGPIPTRADACVALARVSDAADATKLYTRGARLEPARFEPTRALLRHLADTRDAAATAKLLARLAADPRWIGDPFRRLVAAAAAGAEPAAAGLLLTAARPLLPNHAGWLAATQAAAGLSDDARKTAEVAANSPTATPDDWLRLALLAGPDVLTSAKPKLSESGFAAAATSYAESPAGKSWAYSPATPAARRAFAQAALGLKLARGDRAGGIATLESFAKTANAPADARWADRQLAMLLIVRGDPADRTQALSLLAAAADGATTPDDLRAAAAAFGSAYRYLDGADRTAALGHAIRLLERLTADAPAGRDGLTLSQLYRAAGRTGDARKRLNLLLAADGDNLETLLAALDELTDANEFTVADGFAARLTALFPAEFRVTAAAARLDAKAGRGDKALARIETATRGVDSAANYSRAADLLAELAAKPPVAGTPAGRAMADAAVAKYETVLPGRPDVIAAAAGVLAADARGTDGFALIEKYSRVLSPRSKAVAGLAALRPGSGSEAQFAKVQSWLTAARDEDPESVVIRLAAAEWHALRHDYAAAEAGYEDALAADPRNVTALNNLAWILAPRPDAGAKAEALLARAVRETGMTPEILDTRARVRIAAKQFAPAEGDLTEALRQGRTPLRLFHLSLAKQNQNPPQKAAAETAFREARQRGLDANAVHPYDLPQYRAFAGGS